MFNATTPIPANTPTNTNTLGASRGVWLVALGLPKDDAGFEGGGASVPAAIWDSKSHLSIYCKSLEQLTFSLRPGQVR